MLGNLLNLITKAFVRLRTAAMNPFRRVVRRIQQLFNVNLITAKLITPINKKIREILNVKPKSREDYVTVGIFWISKKLLYFLILASCAGVFIYFTWFAPQVADTVSSTNVVTTTYYDYDDMDLSAFSGKANIRAANGEVVYTGDIADGVCTGMGTLWNQDGVLIYEGAFENNAYAGAGTIYYSNKQAKYKGNFINSQFSGSGQLFYEDGTIAYEGNFENGMYSGAGTLYDEKGNMLYTGNFVNGNYSGSGTLYYENGVKEYEGEFYIGKMQGAGTYYSSTGKQLFTGNFAKDEIQYESLLDTTMDTVLTMCSEAPKIYYSSGTTCFVFEKLGIALETDCIVAMKKQETDSEEGSDWYLPDSGEEEELPEQGEDTVTVEFADDTTADVNVNINQSDDGSNDVSVEQDSEESVELPAVDTAGSYDVYYYLSSGEWMKEADLDYSQIQVTGLVVFNGDFDTDFLKDEYAASSNGEAGLLECLSIDQLRADEPTLFSNISFTESVRNKQYIQISDMNPAEAIYVQTYELENVRYKLCYESDNYKELRFICMESY